MESSKNLRDWNWTITTTIRIVDNCIERLIKPLPENGLCWCSKIDK